MLPRTLPPAAVQAVQAVHTNQQAVQNAGLTMIGNTSTARLHTKCYPGGSVQLGITITTAEVFMQSFNSVQARI
jgi:hypothetical protein